MYFVKYGNEYLHDPRIDGRVLLDLTLDCEENSCGYCDFTIYPNHPMYDKLTEHDADNPVEVYDDGILLFAGFIYELGKEFYLDGHVKCKGELDYLAESIVRPYSTVEKGYGITVPNTLRGYFDWLIAHHNSQTSGNKQFKVGINQANALTNDGSIFAENIDYPTTISEISEKLISVYGGYLVVRHENGVRYIDYLAEWTDSNSQILDFGVNLTDYTQTDDAVDVATFVVPLGAKMSETNYEYDDGFYISEDTSVDPNKTYYTESGDGYTRSEDLTSFEAGVTYYESDEYGYFVTSDTAVDENKWYYTRNEYIYGFSQASNLVDFKTNITYYEYFVNEDEAGLSLTVDGATDGQYGYPGFLKSGDLVYSIDGVKKYGWIGYSYKNQDIATRQELIEAATIDLKQRVSPKRTIEIKAVDMHLVNPSIKPIRIGEYVRIRSNPHNLDSYFLCASISLDLNTPENSMYVLGTTFDTLTGQQNKKINQLNATINKQFERVETEVARQASLDAAEASRLANEAYTTAVDASATALNARNVADAATARVTLVETQVTTVEASAESAIQQAAAAATAAGEATALATQIQNEVDGVQGDALTLRAAIEDQIETKVATMTADYVSATDLTTTETTLRTEISQSAASVMTSVDQTYAKTTDLTSVEADLRSELRQTSSSIESVVNDITTIQVDVTTAQTAADNARTLANAAQGSANEAEADAALAQAAATTAQNLANAAQADVDALRSSTTTRFSQIEQTSTSISSNVSELQTTMGTTETRVSEIEQDVSGLSVSLTNTNTNVGNAAKGATDYLSFSSAGLAVGDMTAGTLGKNVLIGPDSVNIRNGSTVLASFGVNEVEFDKAVTFKADGVLMDNGDAFTYLGRNTILWSGGASGYWMNASQSITLSANITRQISGAVFAWSLYQNGAAVDSDWHFIFVPKYQVVNFGGNVVRMHDAYLGMNKILYVSNGNVSGHAQNSTSGTTNGIAWDNTKWVLRYVVGV